MHNDNTIHPHGQPVPTLLTVFDHDLRQLHSRIGIDRTRSTYVRRRQMRNYVALFLREQLHTADIPLARLTPAFISDFAVWLSTGRHYRGGTVWLACQQLKSTVSSAYQRGLMGSNPFYAFHIGRNIRPRQYLTEHELQRLMALPVADPLEAFHRDLFVFSALTGMSFADICRLRPQDICLVGGHQWVVAQRHKTRTPFQVRLLPQAARIVSRYGHGRGDAEPAFGNITYRTLAKHIPLLVSRCGISKHITFHCARHTFAVTALNAGMPIESISRILGHSNIATTQIYAKITLTKLGHDMDEMIKNLKKCGIID